MKRSSGLTEEVWASLSEDCCLLWKYFSRAVVALGAFFVVKTGNVTFDWILGMVTTTFLVIVVETQRSYSKLKPALRKGSLRVAITLGTSGIAILGLAIFMQAGLAASVEVWLSDVGPHLSNTRSTLIKIALPIIFLLALLVAMIRVFRELHIAELIFYLPRQWLIQLLIHKKPKATSFLEFAYIELFALFACLGYASSVASIYSGFAKVFHLS